MDDFIFLIKENAAEQDEAGNWQDIGPTKRKVFAKAQSPTRSEYFGAMQAGYETALVFELSAWDYAGEAIVELGAYPWGTPRYDPSELLKTS